MAIKVRDLEDEKLTEVTISGENREQVEEVKGMLYIHKEEFKVDNSKVSFIIGKQGVRIRDILEKANLLKIDFDQENKQNSENTKNSSKIL